MIRAAFRAGHTLRGRWSSALRPGVRRHKASPVAVSVDQRQPNKRLKLAAPGLGRIPFVPQRTSCSFVNAGPPAAWGAAA